MEDVIRDAIGLGLNEICITGHVDYGIKVDWDSGQEIDFIILSIHQVEDKEFWT